MINDVGKTSAIVRLNDYVVNMVNATIPASMSAGINILDFDGATIRYSMAINADGVNARCLMFARSFAGDAMSATLRPVIYVPPNVQDAGMGGVTCIPLYECISPCASKLINGNEQLTWWTNMDEMPDSNGYGGYIYDYAKVHKFRSNDLNESSANTSACKILCTAPIYWERLQMANYDNRVYNTPVIRDIAILTVVQGEGYIVDFMSGGSGSGIKMHNHLSNLEGGFAGAVFMPSAVPRVMSWM